MSPALILNSRRLRWYLPLVAPFVTSISKERVDAGKNIRGRLHYGYSRYPLNGLRAMIKLNRHIRAQLPGVTAPALIMHSRLDITTPLQNAVLVLNTIGSEDKTLITYDHADHVLPDSSEKEKVWADILDFVTRHIPEQTRAVSV